MDFHAMSRLGHGFFNAAELMVARPCLPFGLVFSAISRSPNEVQM